MKTYIAAMKELEAKFKSVTGRRPSAFRVHPEVYRTIEKEVFGVVSFAFPIAADDKDVREAFGAQFSATISIRGIRVIGIPTSSRTRLPAGFITGRWTGNEL